MFPRRLRHHAAFVALALQLLLGVGLSRALVLCRGADGHIAVESTFADVCGALPGSADPTMAPSEHARCGNCIDTPLLTASLRPDDAGARDTPVPAAVALAPPEPPRRSTSWVALGVAAPVASPVALRRTIVLLV